MITMNPVLLCGRSIWDRSFFPLDEFEERIRIVSALMAKQGIDALLVFGACVDYANLVYLTHFVPRSGWAITIIPLKGDSTLFFSAGGDRDIPFMRTTTWIQDVRHLNNIGSGINATLKEKYPATRRLGIIGMHIMPSQLCDVLLSSLSQFDVIEADHLVRSVGTRLRPRERSAIKQAALMAALAKQKMVEFFSRGEPIQKAVVQAELAARKRGAHDVRLLTHLGHGQWLSSLEDFSLTHPKRLIAYIAVEFQGYWADVAVTFPVPESDIGKKARYTLQNMIIGAKPGSTGGAIANDVLKELGPDLAGHAMEVGLGNGIGLSLEQPPIVKIDGRDSLIEGDMLSLKLYVPDNESAIFFSDLVVVGEDGAHTIFPPDG